MTHLLRSAPIFSSANGQGRESIVGYCDLEADAFLAVLPVEAGKGVQAAVVLIADRNGLVDDEGDSLRGGEDLSPLDASTCRDTRGYGPCAPTAES
ncbi:hypothetical protein [Streptomyces sp. NPDC001903]|uniref:hypothetical protein n=1 Tax=Streptomyces sp. NPDC001903 TaxID=3364622 RepID=UPI0036897D7B